MDSAKRASCGDIVEIFKEFNRRCLRDDGYCTEPIRRPRRSSTDLSELMATPTTSFRQRKNQFDMTPLPKHDSRVKEAMNSGFTRQNGRHPNREPRSVLRPLGINTREATQPACQVGIPSDPVTEATPIVADEVGEGIDTNMEQDSHMSSPKKVHFVQNDSGVGMNDDDSKSDYFGPNQNEEGLSSGRQRSDGGRARRAKA
jgi:hypothetical protein